MNKKIFISQPMNGKTKEQIVKERQEFIVNTVDFYSRKCEIINSILDLEEGKSPMYHLSKSIKLLDQADVVWFMKGWEKARGCKIEHIVAVAYGKEVMYE